MIKIIAFDLVGVLVSEKDIELNEIEDKLERMFGPNVDDTEFTLKARQYIDQNSILMSTTEELIFKLYRVREKDLFRNIKDKYNNIKIIIATNHVSFIRNFIEEVFGGQHLDDLIISAEIHKIKPNSEFYEYILNKYDINPEELLFLDDNIENINSAKNMGINTIKVNKETIILDEVINILEEIN